KALCTVLKRPDLKTDDRFQTNPDRVVHREVLVPLLQEAFLTKPTAYWQDKCQENNIPCGPIQNLEEVVNDPQLQAREMFMHAENTSAVSIKMLGRPLKISQTPVKVSHHSPDAGEHNEAILKNITEQY